MSKLHTSPRPMPDVAVEEASGASWYASAEMTSCSEWEDQDPDYYRMMAAPRPAAPPVEVEVELDLAPVDAEPDDDQDELETVLPEDESTLPTDPPVDADDVHRAVLAGRAQDLLDEAGLDEGSLDDLADIAGELGAWEDDDISWVGRTALQLGSAPRWLAALETTAARRDRTPRAAAALVPAYELQCGLVDGEHHGIAAGRRSSPTRIARRLWQRDLERIGL